MFGQETELYLRSRSFSSLWPFSCSFFSWGQIFTWFHFSFFQYLTLNVCVGSSFFSVGRRQSVLAWIKYHFETKQKELFFKRAFKHFFPSNQKPDWALSSDFLRELISCPSLPTLPADHNYHTFSVSCSLSQESATTALTTLRISFIPAHLTFPLISEPLLLILVLHQAETRFQPRPAAPTVMTTGSISANLHSERIQAWLS